MSGIPRISDAEWKVMEVLWSQSPLSAAEVYEKLGSDTKWQLRTVRTLITRLVEKGIAGREKVHGIWVFSPVVEREKCVRQESRSFLSRFFGSRPVPMMAHFLENEDLSDEEISNLRKILDKKANK